MYFIPGYLVLSPDTSLYTRVVHLCASISSPLFSFCPVTYRVLYRYYPDRTGQVSITTNELKFQQNERQYRVVTVSQPGTIAEYSRTVGPMRAVPHIKRFNY